VTEYTPVPNEEKETIEERTPFDAEAFAKALDKNLQGIDWSAGIEQLSLREALSLLQRNLAPMPAPSVPGMDPKEIYQAAQTEVESQERLANAPELPEEPVYTQKFVFEWKGDIYSRPFDHYKRDHTQLRRDMAATLGPSWRNAFRTIKVVNVG